MPRVMHLQQTTKREVLKRLLAENGWSHWTVLEPDVGSQTDCESSWVLFSFKTKRLATVAIPSDWFDDPRRDNVIGELIALAIDNCSHNVPLPILHKLRKRARSRVVAA